MILDDYILAKTMLSGIYDNTGWNNLYTRIEFTVTDTHIVFKAPDDEIMEVTYLVNTAPESQKLRYMACFIILRFYERYNDYNL